MVTVSLSNVYIPKLSIGDKLINMLDQVLGLLSGDRSIDKHGLRDSGYKSARYQ